MIDAITHINGLDVAVVLILIGGMLVGFGQGVLRQLFTLVALYVSIVVSARFNAVLALRLEELQPSMMPSVAQVIAFFTLMFLLGGILTFIVLDLLGGWLDKDFGTIGRLGGGVIGLFIAALFVVVSLIALAFVTNGPWPGGAEGMRETLSSAQQRSNIIPSFRILVPPLLQTIRPWVPELPPLFNVDLQNFH